MIDRPLSVSIRSTTDARPLGQSAPVFVLGCPRSGTSLLSRMIDAHPRIAVPFESHFYNVFDKWTRYYGDLNEPLRQREFVADILDSDVFADWEPQPDRRRTLQAIGSPGFQGIVAALMQTWAHDQGKARWGEKTPHHAFYWSRIFDDFPNAQVIHIVRDGRDVALSWMRARFGPKHVYQAAQSWMRYLSTMEQIRNALSERAYLAIHYEDLIADPQAVLERVCAFLGEPFAPQMLSFYRQETKYNTDARNRENLKQPVLAENSQKWRKEMTPRDLRIFEAVGGETLQRYGYERSLHHPTLSTAEVFNYRYWEHPPRKAWAMLKNRKGQRDALIRLKIYLRLRCRNYFFSHSS